MSLSSVQQEIVDTPGNMIVSASAGTGKTHTMVSKIAKELEINHSHKVIAAITFTVKAAKEIRDRLSVDCSEQFIGTNNSFAIEEIIKPFIRDVYGNEYQFDMSTDYSVKKKTFQECLEYLRISRTICSYEDNKKNFVFDIALDIVKKSLACRRYLKAKFFKIYVDEYQDCDRTMHEFFMYLCNDLGIEFFIVGDEKQSIYIWRGAYPEAFKSILEMDNFQKKMLRENYRSCQQIQNYSNLLDDATRDLYRPQKDKSAIVYVKATTSNWVEKIESYVDLNQTCALLRFRNDTARVGADELSVLGTEFTYIPKTPISDITTEVSWLYNSIAQYFILPKYSIYDFMDEIPEESVGDRKIKSYIKNRLDAVTEALQENNDLKVIREVGNIATYFGYTISEDHVGKMIRTIANPEFYPAFQMEEFSHVAITFHASKGLEFEQVIIFASDYDLSTDASIYNHYVAATRAKSKLIIVQITDTGDWRGRKYCQNLSTLFGKAGVRPQDVMQII